MAEFHKDEIVQQALNKGVSFLKGTIGSYAKRGRISKAKAKSKADAKAKAKTKPRGRSNSRGKKAKAAPADAVSAERANGKPQKDYRPRWGGLLACFQYRDHGTCNGKERKGQTLYAHVTKETYERELKKLLEQKKRDITARRTAATLSD